MVVTDQEQRAAKRAGACKVGVAQRVLRKNAIDFCAGEDADILRAPGGGRGHILVQPRLEIDVVFFQLFRSFLEVHVVSPDRRTAIS